MGTITSMYPVLMTDDVAATADFYRRHLAFETAFEADWYVSLRRAGHELAVLSADHETVPAALRGRAAAGVLINVEVEDADAEWERLVTAGPLEAILPIRSEGWGQRHFIVAAPDGVLLDVIQPIEPSPEFAAAFA